MSRVLDLRFRLVGVGKLLTPQIFVEYMIPPGLTASSWRDATPEDLIEIARYIERKQA